MSDGAILNRGMSESEARLYLTLKELRLAATILLNNCERCVMDHHGHDITGLGLPGWLADCKKCVERATTLLAEFDRHVPRPKQIGNGMALR